MIKWIGQHIFDLIARFRGDVYLEDIADGTVASDKFLGLDANNKIVKETVSTTVTDLHSAGVDGAANQLLTDDGDGTVTSEANLTFSSEALRIGADDDGEATIGRNTHSDGNGGDLFIAAGDGTGTDKTGGDLKLNGGASTGSALGGEILMYGSQRQGSSNANVNTQVLLWQTLINDSIIQQQLSSYKGPTDGHFYIQSDDSLTLTIDIDNDSSTSYFAIKDYTTTKLLMPDEGNLYLMSSATETGLFLDAVNSIVSAGSKAAHSGTDANTDANGAANAAGKTLTITGGAGTGTGNGGGISFGTYPAGSSSVNVNTTYEEKMAMDKDGNLQIDGGLTTGSTSFVNSSGVVQVATQGTIDHDSLANFVAAEHYDWSSDISGTATVHANNITDLHGAGVDGSANQLLTDDGDGTVTSESNLSFDGSVLSLGGDDDASMTIKRAAHSDDDGGDMYIRGGDATAGQTNKGGGGVRLYAGRSTGSASGGNIGIFGVPAGSSGTSLNSVDTTQAIAVFKSDGKTTTLGGNLIFEGATPDANETTFSITDPTADRTITVPDADVDLTKVNFTHETIHMHFYHTGGANSNDYITNFSHYNFNVNTTVALTDGVSKPNRWAATYGIWIAMEDCTVTAARGHFSTDGGANDDGVFQLWTKPVTAGGTTATNIDLEDTWSMSSQNDQDHVFVHTLTSTFTMSAGEVLIPTFKRAGSSITSTSKWYGDVAIRVKYAV